MFPSSSSSTSSFSNSYTHTGFGDDCEYFQYNECQKEWLKCTIKTICLLNELGDISIRNQSNLSIIVLLNTRSITISELLSSTIMRFTTHDGKKIAIKFTNSSSLSSFLEIYQRKGIKYIDLTANPELPKKKEIPIGGEYDDKALQDFFLNVLHTDGYDKFVTRIESWLKCYRGKLESYYSSQGKTEHEESTCEQDDLFDTDQPF